MNRKLSIVVIGLLLGGCAATGGSSEEAGSAGQSASTAVVAKRYSTSPKPAPAPELTRRERFGNWKISCAKHPVNYSSHCKAETFGPVTLVRGEPEFKESIVVWVSWVMGQPKTSRSVCVFGQHHPVEDVILQVDQGEVARLKARKASGCFSANEDFLKQLREGHRLNVTFRRWPWGETRAFVSLDKSANALAELDRLVAGR